MRWNIQYTFDRSTRGPIKANFGYTYNAAENKTDLLNFGYASLPFSTPTAPAVPFNASVTFESGAGGIWDTVTITDSRNKPQTISRNDILRPLSQGAALVINMIAQGNFKQLTEVCMANGLL